VNRTFDKAAQLQPFKRACCCGTVECTSAAKVVWSRSALCQRGQKAILERRNLEAAQFFWNKAT